MSGLYVDPQTHKRYSTGLAVSDLVPGEVYHCHDHEGEIVFQFKEDIGDEDRPLAYYYVSDMPPTRFCRIGDASQIDCTPWITNRHCRKATTQEMAWLFTCEELDKYVEKNEKLLSEALLEKIKEKNEELLTKDLMEKIQKSAEHILNKDEGKEYTIYLNKTQEELTFEDFYHGQKFEGYIRETYTEGKITIENGLVYLCQNVQEGAICKDKQGYTLSYRITKTDKPNTVLLIKPESPFVIRELKIEDRFVFGKPNEVSEVYKEIVYLNYLNSYYLAEASAETLPTIVKAIHSNVHEQSLYTDFAQSNVQRYIEIVGLEDPADDRLMMNFADDLSFLGFSSIHGGPIFKLKDNGQTVLHWYKLLDDIGKIGGMTNMVSDISTHLPGFHNPKEITIDYPTIG